MLLAEALMVAALAAVGRADSAPTHAYARIRNTTLFDMTCLLSSRAGVLHRSVGVGAGKPVLRGEAGVPLSRVLDRSLLGLVVDVDQAKALGEAEAPLEVVEDRPDEVAAHRGAVGEGLVGRGDVAGEVADADGVAHAAVGAGRVGPGRPALGHEDRRRAVVALDAEERAVEPLGRDLPLVEVGARDERPVDLAGGER